MLEENGFYYPGRVITVVTEYNTIIQGEYKYIDDTDSLILLDTVNNIEYCIPMRSIVITLAPPATNLPTVKA